MSKLIDKIPKWTLEGVDGPNYNDIMDFINFRADYFDQYHPTIGPFPPFLDRLESWIGGATNEENQKNLLQIVPEILFFGMDEFIALYRAVFNEQIYQWLTEMENLMVDSPNLNAKLKTAVKKTWFCPITDSMHIADFYHVNNIEKGDLRPDWRSLKEFGSTDAIKSYMSDHDLSYIVLLEDFICTGQQAEEAVAMAAKLPEKYPVLVIPLILCPKGLDMGKRLITDYKNVWFSPGISLPKELFLSPMPMAGEPECFRKLRRTCIELENLVQSPSGPFGYKDSGGLIVMYTNCPDNTLPIINNAQSSSWEPLFPRSSRL